MLMEANELAVFLYDFVLSSGDERRKPDEDEQRIWAEFLGELQTACGKSGCGGDASSFFQSRLWEKAFGYHREYGYFAVDCGDRGELYLSILEKDREEARNYFLNRITDKMAYDFAVARMKEEEAVWQYRCPFDYRKIWFEQALSWLAPVVDWGYFAECAGRYVELLNYHFTVAHWEYDFELGHIIEAGIIEEKSRRN